MPGIHAKSAPLIARQTPYPPGAGDAARAVRATRLPGAEDIAVGFENLGKSVQQLQSAARQSKLEITEFVVTDGTTGRVIASLGEYEKNGIQTSGGYFSELYAGDPYGDSDPANAILKVTRDGKVQVGQNGWLDVLDPYSESAAWIGTQFDTLPVTGASSASGLIRLTVAAHTLATGDVVRVLDVGGVPNATGIFTVTSIGANTIDLQNSVFVGTYTSGGTVDRLLHITGAANNGSGLIRITRAAHGYESGDKVNIQAVGGVPNATGRWIIDVASSSTFDLLDSTWAGAYTSGGTSLRYFAGGLFQTIAIGPSFPNYKLRAFADGSLKIRDSEITLDGSGALITLDPDTGTISIHQAGGGLLIQLTGGGIHLTDDDEPGDDTQISVGYYRAVHQQLSSVTSSKMLDITGYTGGSEFGPLLAFTQIEGSVGAESPSATNDILGGVIARGYDGATESTYPVAIRMKAAENHSAPAHGTKITFEVTTNASTTPIVAATLDHDGTLDVANGYKVGGVNGVDLTASFGMSLTVNNITNAVRGTPGAGQSNFTAVNTVTLNTTSRTFTGGLLTV